MQLTSISNLLLALFVEESLRQEFVGAGPVLWAVVQRDGAKQDGGPLGQAVASDGGVSVQYSAGRKFQFGEVSGMTGGRGAYHAEREGKGIQEAVSQVQLQVVARTTGRWGCMCFQTCGGMHGRLTCCSPAVQQGASADPP